MFRLQEETEKVHNIRDASKDQGINVAFLLDDSLTYVVDYSSFRFHTYDQVSPSQPTTFSSILSKFRFL